jgi:two-component system CheB/CheR fusion protein
VLRPEPRRSKDGGYHPIDILFNSLAVDQANAGVGILLSGNGSDGVIGLEQIKAEGGITFAQTEGTAGFPTLPHNAFVSGCVDFVLPPDAIAAELRRIAKHPLVLRAKAIPGDGEPQSDLHRIFAMLRALNGVDFSYYKHSTLKRRIMRRMVLRKIESLNRYVTYLRRTRPRSICSFTIC